MRSEPGQGRCKIGEHSSLKKLMRAARRGRVPQERIGVISRAMQSAASRPEAWENSYKRTMNAWFAHYNAMHDPLALPIDEAVPLVSP